jgi:predicted ferric reductase
VLHKIIPINSEIAWLLMSLMVLLALFARRRSYELFLYTHSLAVGVFVTVLVHAWSAWFFLMPPLLFWLLDKALRTCRTRAAPVLALDTGCGGITRGEEDGDDYDCGEILHEILFFIGLCLRFFFYLIHSRFFSVILPSSALGCGSEGGDTTHHFAGQWVWLNIPALSPLAWHPFSISSPPESSVITLHIKSQGTGTFTQSMYWVMCW